MLSQQEHICPTLQDLPSRLFWRLGAAHRDLIGAHRENRNSEDHRTRGPCSASLVLNRVHVWEIRRSLEQKCWRLPRRGTRKMAGKCPTTKPDVCGDISEQGNVNSRCVFDYWSYESYESYLVHRGVFSLFTELFNVSIDESDHSCLHRRKLSTAILKRGSQGI